VDVRADGRGCDMARLRREDVSDGRPAARPARGGIDSAAHRRDRVRAHDGHGARRAVDPAASRRTPAIPDGKPLGRDSYDQRAWTRVQDALRDERRGLDVRGKAPAAPGASNDCPDGETLA